MRRFANLLVGIDLTYENGVIAAELPPPTLEAIARATWLAKLNSARITFFHALDVSPAARQSMEASTADGKTVLHSAKQVLAQLAATAKADGVKAGFEVRFGKSWTEIIRQVLRNEHDLVVAGTRHLGPFKSLIVGSTGTKLLRKCPCPVWITQPQAERQIKSILVAHCLRSVGDIAMDLGCSLAQLHGAQLYVFHSLEFPELESAFPERVTAEKTAHYRTTAEQHVHAQLEKYTFAQSPQVNITTDAPEFAILREIEKHDVELVVMGTVARTGVGGFITGNTAERLLPQIPCSVLAVKPPDFVSPVEI